MGKGYEFVSSDPGYLDHCKKHIKRAAILRGRKITELRFLRENGLTTMLITVCGRELPAISALALEIRQKDTSDLPTLAELDQAGYDLDDL